MKFKHVQNILFFLIAITGFSNLSGQGILPQAEPAEKPKVQSDSVEILPFPASGITEAFNSSFSLMSDAGKSHLTEEELTGYSDFLDTLFVTIDEFLGDSSTISIELVTLRELDNLSQRSNYFILEISEFHNRLSSEEADMEGASKLLLENKDRWLLTLETASEDEFSEDRLSRIETTIHQVDSVKGVLQGDLQNIQVFQDKLTEKSNDLKSVLNQVKEQKLVLGDKLWRIDMPGFFSELATLSDSSLIPSQMEQINKSIQSDLEIFESDFLVSYVILILFGIALLIFTLWYKSNYESLMSVEKFELTEIHLAIINSPVYLAIFLTTFLIRFILPELPSLISEVNSVLFMIAMTGIVIRINGDIVKSWMRVLLALLILVFVYEFIYYPDIILRMVLLFFSVTAFIFFLILYIKRPKLYKFNKGFPMGLFRVFQLGIIVLLFISIVGNLVGAVDLAEFFTLGIIQVTVLAIAIRVTTRVSNALIYLALASKKAQRLNVIKDELHVILKRSTRIINFLLWIFFFSVALNIFHVKDTFVAWGLEWVTTGWTVGDANITPRSIFIFFFVIWLSTMVTKIVRFVLEKDVFVRIQTSKGMPNTIILLVRIAMISAGFFLAASAAGMALTNLSIVIGAFSVGIGFGLQNIFNNMVSGLILAFERPIKVGDTVQVGELMGIVLAIRLRSSTVRSFDGAEVIVPNGNLISNEMINWTLTDTTRRMDIRIGVAYGTDPDTVIGILQDIANTHSQVDNIPLPTAYFLGFGDSSLDFRLLAWTNIYNRLTVESELNVAVNNKIKEAGIEIPFPQHDLHVRSDDTKPQTGAKPETPPKPKTPPKTESSRKEMD